MDSPANLLVITDSVIQMMLGDARFLAAVPCLKTGAALAKKPGCGRCGKKPAKAATPLDGIRACLAGLRGGSLKAVKELLNARQLRITAPNGSGMSVTYTLGG